MVIAGFLLILWILGKLFLLILEYKYPSADSEQSVEKQQTSGWKFVWSGIKVIGIILVLYLAFLQTQDIKRACDEDRARQYEYSRELREKAAVYEKNHPKSNPYGHPNTIEATSQSSGIVKAADGYERKKTVKGQNKLAEEYDREEALEMGSDPEYYKEEYGDDWEDYYDHYTEILDDYDDED